MWLGFGAGLLGAGWLAAALGSAGESAGLGWATLLWLAGILVGSLALLRLGKPQAQALPAVWSVERALRYLRQKEADKAQPVRSLLGLERRTIGLILVGLTLLGLLLRLWNFAGLPAGCSAAECESALAAMRLLTGWDLRAIFGDLFPATTLLTAGTLGLLGISQKALFWLGILLGSASIPLYYAAASRFATPEASLLGTLLIVFSPSLIALSRHPAPALFLMILVIAYLAVRPGPNRTESQGRWVGSSLLAGLLLWAAPPPLVWLLAAWYLLTPPGRRSLWPVYYLPLIAIILPRLATNPWQPGNLSLAVFADQSLTLGAQLLEDGGYLPALLALLGAAYWVRYLRWRQGWLWSAGFIIVGLSIFAGPHARELAMAAPLLALLGIAASVALDQVLGAFSKVWLPVLGTRWVMIGGAVCLLLPLTVGSLARMDALVGQMAPVSADESAAIGDYLYRHFDQSADNGGPDETLVLVPASVLNSPATKLSAQGVLARSPHIVALDPVVHLPFTGPPFIEQGVGDLLYILPVSEPALLRYVNALYPGMAGQPIQDSEERTWGMAYPVSRGAVANAQGLSAFYYAGEEIGALQEAVDARREGPLEFPWAKDAPVAAPFTLIGKGALYAPVGGVYGLRFRREGDVTARLELSTPGPPPGVLDSGASIEEIVVELPQGFHALNLTAHLGEKGGGLSVQWRQPEGEWETIPRAALYNGNLALGSGLVASYYSGVEEAGVAEAGFGALAERTPTHWRVEPWVAGSELAATSSAVVWQGKLAAPVEGSYRFGAEADGPYQLEADGILLLDSVNGQISTNTLLLSQGWHDIILRYRSGGEGKIRLGWQPPGSANEIPIAPDFLASLLPSASTKALSLPALPAQTAGAAPASGEPTQAAAPQPGLQTPTGEELPSNLPALPLTLAWQVGSCGADLEQFQQPRGVTLNPRNQYVYIADQGNRRVILRAMNDGGLVDFYENDAFEEPFDLDVDLLGNVFLLDAVTQTIYRFEELTGVPVALPSGTAFYRPRGLGMDLNGNFYVADTGGARVVKLTGIDGHVEFQAGGPDSLLGQGQPVDAMALPTGAIYAVTAQDGTLWRLDTGESWRAMAPASTIDGPHLAGLTTSAFFLSDPERRLITYFNGAGQPLGQLRSDLFVKPVGVGTLLVDGDILLAVSDSAACQVTLWRGPLDAMPTQ